MPIHIHAQPGDYAEACLLPGDPNRARVIAERFLDGAVQRTSERGLLGYTGSANGKQVSVQATGIGGASTAIVVEELVELGVKRFLRVGTCGALQPDLRHGDLLLALSAVPDDGTSVRYAGGQRIAPTADWDLLHGIVHAAKELGERPRVGPIVSTDVFYDPDAGSVERWRRLGLLAVEMEAATLFTVAALRGVQAGCLLTVSDVLVDGPRSRISPGELESAVERMARIALAGV